MRQNSCESWVTALRQRDVKKSRRTGLANEPERGLIANNGVRLRGYLDSPRFDPTEFSGPFLLPNLRRTPEFKPILCEYTTNSGGPFPDVRYAQTPAASLFGEYVGGHVHSLVGRTRL